MLPAVLPSTFSPRCAHSRSQYHIHTPSNHTDQIHRFIQSSVIRFFLSLVCSICFVAFFIDFFNIVFVVSACFLKLISFRNYVSVSCNFVIADLCSMDHLISLIRWSSLHPTQGAVYHWIKVLIWIPLEGAQHVHVEII